MKAGGGKSKGSSFERKMCKALSLWITNGTMDSALWRTSLSGGRATVRGARRKTSHHISGDICAVHSAGESFINMFYIECKFYRAFDWHRLLLDHDGTLATFWKTTRKHAVTQKKLPMLIFKQNGSEVLFAFTYSALERLSIDDRYLFEIPALNMYVTSLKTLVNYGIKFWQ